jgi:hypothetical protein
MKVETKMMGMIKNPKQSWLPLATLTLVGLFTQSAVAGVGDPQLRTDHPWYPGELACSTFERLFKTQADVYQRVVGKRPTTDQQLVLAAWLWRNTHYWHGEQGVEDLWGKGFQNNSDAATRDYWTGLFSHGFGLCGTTHAQWTAEMQSLLGHNRSRVVGVTGHNSFEVFLTGGDYGDGRWALLDHDISTVIFDDHGHRLLSIKEIQQDLARLTKQNVSAAKQHGWLVSGLHPNDGSAYDTYRSAEYFAGYSGPPPIVHLRRGESLRRYLAPGLGDGKTFVYWGRNYNTGNIPGPERSRTWVNQPEKMYRSINGTPHRDGQSRYSNAVYTYQPDFKSDDYLEGVIDQSANHVTIEFQSPYIIAATPRSTDSWAIYEEGCRNGLVVTGNVKTMLQLSVDRGASWHEAALTNGRADLTDAAKGHRQYWLRIDTGADQLRDANLKIVTVCQANSSIIPRLSDNGCQIQFQSTGHSVVSAGPNLAQAQRHIVDGKFDTPRVALALAAPRGERLIQVYAAAHIASSNPPSPDIAYQIDYSTSGGRSWKPIVNDWTISRRGQEPNDFWSQSFCWGNVAIDDQDKAKSVRIRFRNNGGKRYRRAEAQLVYQIAKQDRTLVTFRWQDSRGTHTASREFASAVPAENAKPWTIDTGNDTRTVWVEYSVARTD